MKPATVITRLDGAADLDAVLEIDQASFSSPWTREMYHEELRNDRSFIFVARRAECPVVGYCSFWVILDEIHVNNIATRPEWRRRGIGRDLVKHVLGEGWTRGCHAATLEVRRSNMAALRLYESVGFVEQGVRRRYYRDPDEDALVLWATIQNIGGSSGT
jgi:[ribosomal protein S18]-alanine N-acetyltransferase